MCIAVFGIGYVVLSELDLMDLKAHFYGWAGLMLAFIAIGLALRGFEAKRNIRDLDQKIQTQTSQVQTQISQLMVKSSICLINELGMR